MTCHLMKGYNNFYIKIDFSNFHLIYKANVVNCNVTQSYYSSNAINNWLPFFIFYYVLNSEV